MSYLNKRNRHYVAIVLAVAFIVLLLFEFASFAVGAYYVYNEPASNVLALTDHNGGNVLLNITAIGLDPGVSREIWIDPAIAYDSAGNAYIDVNTGYQIATVTTNSSGDVQGSYQISASTLSQIESDGNTVHYVWIAGVGETPLAGSPQYVSLTSDSEQNYTAATVGSGIILFVTLITVDIPITFNLGQLFIVLWTVYIILFAMALNGPFKSLIGAIKDASVRGIEGLMDNAMFATLIVFPVVLWGTVLLSLIQAAGGISTGSLPTVDPLLEFVELAIAPLREEIGFRMIPIGVAALIVLMAKGKVRDGLLALWHPSRYLKKNDTPEQYKRHLNLIYVMIGVSALLFGLAHVLLGAGWGPGKIASAAAAGVALGGLYYVYGLPSTILLHWSIDYFLSAFDFNNSTLLSAYAFITTYTLILAIVGSVVLLLLLIRKLRNRPLESYRGISGVNR